MQWSMTARKARHVQRLLPGVVPLQERTWSVNEHWAPDLGSTASPAHASPPSLVIFRPEEVQLQCAHYSSQPSDAHHLPSPERSTCLQRTPPFELCSSSPRRHAEVHLILCAFAMIGDWRDTMSRLAGPNLKSAGRPSSSSR